MDNNDQKIKLMAEEKIPKVLLKFSVPVIIGMLVTAFYNVIDAMFVGRLGTSAIGAVSIVFPISMFLMGFRINFWQRSIFLYCPTVRSKKYRTSKSGGFNSVFQQSVYRDHCDNNNTKFF